MTILSIIKNKINNYDDKIQKYILNLIIDIIYRNIKFETI